LLRIEARIFDNSSSNDFTLAKGFESVGCPGEPRGAMAHHFGEAA
jgi:hypothetical protein